VLDVLTLLTGCISGWRATHRPRRCHCDVACR